MDNGSIELDSLFIIALCVFAHRYDSFVESESNMMSPDQQYEDGRYLTDAFLETMSVAISMVQHRGGSQKKLCYQQ